MRQPRKKKPAVVQWRESATEDDFQRTVLDAAEQTGWKHYHTWNSSKSVEGFPDLTLVKEGRLLFLELKKSGGEPSAAQIKWIDLLRTVPGVRAAIVYPEDWDFIVRELRK